MGQNIFVYGIFMTPATTQHHIGRHKRKNATLKDWKRIHLTYAGVEPAPGEQVDGNLLLDLSPEQIRRLDRVEREGRLYNRVDVEVECGGKVVKAQVYEPSSNFKRYYALCQQPWAPELENELVSLAAALS